jgi:hypothetical protein
VPRPQRAEGEGFRLQGQGGAFLVESSRGARSSPRVTRARPTAADALSWGTPAPAAGYRDATWSVRLPAGEKDGAGVTSVVPVRSPPSGAWITFSGRWAAQGDGGEGRPRPRPADGDGQVSAARLRKVVRVADLERPEMGIRGQRGSLQKVRLADVERPLAAAETRNCRRRGFAVVADAQEEARPSAPGAPDFPLRCARRAGRGRRRNVASAPVTTARRPPRTSRATPSARRAPSGARVSRAGRRRTTGKAKITTRRARIDDGLRAASHSSAWPTATGAATAAPSGSRRRTRTSACTATDSAARTGPTLGRTSRPSGQEQEEERQDVGHHPRAPAQPRRATRSSRPIRSHVARRRAARVVTSPTLAAPEGPHHARDRHHHHGREDQQALGRRHEQAGVPQAPRLVGTGRGCPEKPCLQGRAEVDPLIRGERRPPRGTPPTAGGGTAGGRRTAMPTPGRPRGRRLAWRRRYGKGQRQPGAAGPCGLLARAHQAEHGQREEEDGRGVLPERLAGGPDAGPRRRWPAVSRPLRSGAAAPRSGTDGAAGGKREAASLPEDRGARFIEGEEGRAATKRERPAPPRGRDRSRPVVSHRAGERVLHLGVLVEVEIGFLGRLAARAPWAARPPSRSAGRSRAGAGAARARPAGGQQRRAHDPRRPFERLFPGRDAHQRGGHARGTRDSGSRRGWGRGRRRGVPRGVGRRSPTLVLGQGAAELVAPVVAAHEVEVGHGRRLARTAWSEARPGEAIGPGAGRA